jgi:superfamily I DNA/RNA helicase
MNKIILTTIHQAKGLEYDYLILFDMVHNSFTNKRWTEEQCYRLFYTGITRPRKELYFTIYVI